MISHGSHVYKSPSIHGEARPQFSGWNMPLFYRHYRNSNLSVQEKRMMSLAVAQRIQRAAQPQAKKTSGFDYENQAWVIDGRYVSCAHPASMNCNCFGKIHAGEEPAANADIH